MKPVQALLAAVCWGLAALSQAVAQTGSPVPAPGEDDSDVIVVEAPGPELWRLHDADSEIYILATIDALPAGFRWNSRPVAAVLERADRLYVSEPVSLGLGDAARLLVTHRDAIRNPNGVALEEYLPAGLYRRLAGAAATYGVDMDDLEQWRPYMAGGQVLGEAVDEAGLESDGQVLRETRRLARRARVRVQELEFVRTGPLLNALNTMPLGRDNACLTLQLDAIEVQIPALRARASAWARGNVATLREFATLVDSSACLAGLGGPDLTFEDVERRIVASWRTTLTDGLNRPGTRLALISADAFLRPNGILQQLRAEGYAVEGP